LLKSLLKPSTGIENKAPSLVTGSWQQRVWESQLFSDPVVKSFFADNGIIITTYREGMNRFNKSK
jgi:hypothetical protein